MINNLFTLKQLIIRILEKKNAKDITVIKPKKEMAIAKYVILATGISNKNIRAIAEHIVYELKHTIQYSVFSEGLYTSTDWILLDTGHIIVHILHPEARERLRLEELLTEKIKEEILQE